MVLPAPGVRQALAAASPQASLLRTSLRFRLMLYIGFAAWLPPAPTAALTCLPLRSYLFQLSQPYSRALVTYAQQSPPWPAGGSGCPHFTDMRIRKLSCRSMQSLLPTVVA